jgi:transporter family-2 protein
MGTASTKRSFFMSSLRLFFLSGAGIIAGGLIAIQSVLNSGLGQRIGALGSVLVLTGISAVVLIVLILVFPATSNLTALPGLSEWHLYLGGILGVVILATPIYLVPRIGTTSTLIAIMLGQSLFALLIDQFGLFDSLKIEISLARGIGVLLVAIGAYLAGK